MSGAGVSGAAGPVTAAKGWRATWTAPWTALGFLPDAPAFALRTAAALLLAYAVAFYAQIDSASSSGVTVALVAQPAFGMSFSKARYRLGGTLIGGVVALLLLGCFPQDRTLLLMGYAFWLGVCTVGGSLLRDFRAYGTVLSGYTVGIIAIGAIDSPDQGLLTALDRVAAIAIGIGAVLGVNAVTGGPRALDGLTRSLRDGRNAVFRHAAGVLEGGAAPPQPELLRLAAGISALRSQATFAGTELPDGRARINGGRHALEALLTGVTLLRVMEAALAAGADARWRAWLRPVGRALRDGTGADALPPPPDARTTVENVLREGAAELLAQRARADRGLLTLAGEGEAMPFLHLATSYDVLGALLNAIRSTIALALCCWFVVLAGWPGATLLLIQSSAIIALLGAVPNPTAATMPFLWALLPVMAAVGAAKFLLLPSASGFVPFALVCAPLMGLAASMQRHPRLAPFAAPSMLYVTLLLSPSNPQGFDLGQFLNTGMELFVAMTFVVLVFHLILPVVPGRRLWRVGAEILRERAPTPSVLFDRLVRATSWTGRPRPTRARLLGQLQAAGEIGLLRRRAGGLLGWMVAADEGEGGVEGGGMAEAEALLAGPDGNAAPVRRAAAMLAGAALLAREAPGIGELRRRLLR